MTCKKYHSFCTIILSNMDRLTSQNKTTWKNFIVFVFYESWYSISYSLNICRNWNGIQVENFYKIFSMEIFIIPGRLYLLKAQSSYFSMEIIKLFNAVVKPSQGPNSRTHSKSVKRKSVLSFIELWSFYPHWEQLSSNIAEPAVTQFTKLNYTKKKLRDKF